MFSNANNTDASNGVFNEISRDQYNIVFNGSDGLDMLEPVTMDSSGRTECLANTRADVLAFIRGWINNQTNGQTVLWVNGAIGSGKSTLATTIASEYRSSLGAFLFFDRHTPQRNDPTIAIRTLAHQLGSSNLKLRTFICATVQNNPNIRLSSFTHQFQSLVIDPLLSVELAPSSIVIIIDALDECGSPKSREILLRVLAEQSSKLPSAVRVIITSRTDRDISDIFKSQHHILPYELNTTSQANSDDIMTYFRYRMGKLRIQKADLYLGTDWPSEDMLRQLVQQASGLFVWASTASEFINGFNPDKRLRMILDKDSAPRAEAALDDLYTTALQSTTDLWGDEDFVADFRVIMEIILVARQPLLSTSIDALLCLPRNSPSSYLVSLLACVLQQDPAVRVLHSSFADFLMSKERCKRDMWFFDRYACHRSLALQCLKRLDAVLVRNMRKLTLSTAFPNNTLPDNAISDDITYACLYWAEHVCMIEDNAISITDHLCDFLYRHLMHWFEAMSILRKSRDTISLLGRLLDWVSIYSKNHTSLSALVHDAYHFARVFSSFIEEHPLLVYTAALPFSPIHTPLYQTFHDSSLHLSIAGGFQQSWSPALLVLTGHQKEVLSVAVHGSRIVSGSSDHTIRLWDSTSGAEVPPTMRGHRSKVQSVSFSSDGTRIVSGSHDTTVRVWDATSGALVFPPLRGHTGKVTSVAFSPDGARIISGSEDRTIRVWDAALGIPALPELRHKHAVMCVAMTHDGARIISGSHDNTIRIWDASSGILCSSPLMRHDDWILSVSASPNGTHIASGSEDKTIRIWDATTGARLRTLKGHRTRIQAVTFSPDGTRLASCSDDKTIRIWDVTSEFQACSVLQGHHSYLTSIAYSPDGNRLVSGSGDKTIRVWDTTLNADASIQRSFSVSCVTFSPDGQRVASGSFDTTVQIWDTTSGAQVHPPLRGHHGAIFGIAFSPDGTRLVSSSEDKTIRVWNVITGEQVLTDLQRPDDSISSVAFSADGNHIISGLKEGNIQMWDVRLGLKITPLRDQERHQLGKSGFPGVSVDLTDKLIDAWDPAFSRPISWADQHTHPLSSAINITEGGWIVDSITGEKISKLPPVLNVRCAATWGRSLVVGTSNGQVIIMHFAVPL